MRAGKRYGKLLICLFLIMGMSFAGFPIPEAWAGSAADAAAAPLTEHGALRVEKGALVDEKGEKFQLRGMSTHGLAWFPDYVNEEAFRTLRDDWKTNCIRLAMYTEEYGGYCSGGDKEGLKALVKKGVDAASGLGMYVIIDWHILKDGDPNLHKAGAMEFFGEMSALYKDQGNVIYEICNEPNGAAGWESIRSYANEVIPVIRQNDGDAVILVGTPTWSQEIDRAAEAPLEFDNVLYTLHFYAATHTEWLRERLRGCVEKGLPVFVSEFGLCDASGNGNNDFGQAEQWLGLLDEYKISYCCWNLANKAETSSVLLPSSQRLSGWTEEDLSESGKWIFGYFRQHPPEGNGA